MLFHRSGYTGKMELLNLVFGQMLLPGERVARGNNAQKKALLLLAQVGRSLLRFTFQQTVPGVRG